jgi:hypothetical protein
MTDGRSMPSSETPEHKALAGLIRKYGFTEPAVAFHVRNERGSDWERMEAARMGILPGIPDWTFIRDGRAGFVEMKPLGWKARRARGGKYTRHELNQLAVHEQLRRAGSWVEIAESAAGAIMILEQHGIFLNKETPSLTRIKAGLQQATET